MDNINYTNLKRISADIKQITIELKLWKHKNLFIAKSEKQNKTETETETKEWQFVE